MLFLLLPLLLAAALPSTAQARAFKPIKPTKHRATRQAASPINKLKKDAALGDPQAQYQLALKYDRGAGMPKDSQTSAAWLRAAADQGQAQAQLKLGQKYEVGDGVKLNEEIALQWYAAAAEQGIEEAATALQRLYRKQQEEASNE